MVEEQAQEGAPVTQQLTIQTEGEEGQITAEVVQAELPSPGKLSLVPSSQPKLKMFPFSHSRWYKTRRFTFTGRYLHDDRSE